MAEKKTSSKKSVTSKISKSETKVVKEKSVKTAPKSQATKLKEVNKVEKKMNSVNTVTLKQVKSGSGRAESQIGTLVGLGLNKLNKVATLQDTPSVRGMIQKVRHLIKIVKENK